MSKVLLIGSWILTDLLRIEFIFKWPKYKLLRCFALILLFDVFPLVRIPSESENDLEELSFCGHAERIFNAEFNAERIFSVNKVAPLSFKCKPS